VDASSVDERDQNRGAQHAAALRLRGQEPLDRAWARARSALHQRPVSLPNSSAQCKVVRVVLGALRRLREKAQRPGRRRPTPFG